MFSLGHGETEQPFGLFRGTGQPAVRNEGLELWKGAGAKSPSPTEVMVG